MENGIYAHLEDFKYHGNSTHLSSSQLKYALKDMNKFNAHINGELERYDTAALIFGRAAHCYVLENNKFDTTYGIFDDSMDMRRKESKAIKKEFDETAKAKGLEVLKKSDFEKIVDMHLKIQSYDVAKDLLHEGAAEVSYFFTHSSGIDLKVRPDFINHEKKYIVDFKTSRDASSGSFVKDFRWNYHYDLSAAMYLDGVKNITGEDYEYYFVVAEKEAPHSVAVYKLGEDSYKVGKAKYERAIEKIIQARETNIYQLQTRVEEI